MKTVERATSKLVRRGVEMERACMPRAALPVPVAELAAAVAAV